MRTEDETKEETDWELFDIAIKMQRPWEAELRAQLPTNEMDWLRIFPEAAAVIRAKIKEWREVATRARGPIQEALKTVKEKASPENYWFWRAVVKHLFPEVRELSMAKRHIKRLLRLVRANQGRSGTDVREWNEIVQRAREQDIMHVAETYGINLIPSGRTFKALCPKHNEKTPSFYVYPPTHFVCYGCGIKGDVISFVRLMSECSFKEAIYKLNNL